jgi:hypothetical protein
MPRRTRDAPKRTRDTAQTSKPTIVTKEETRSEKQLRPDEERLRASWRETLAEAGTTEMFDQDDEDLAMDLFFSMLRLASASHPTA